MRTLRPPRLKDVLRKRKPRVNKLRSAEKRRIAHWQWLGKKGYTWSKNKYFLLYIADLPCAWCQSRDHRVVDHKLPRALGGSHALSNLQVLCLKCHHKKTRYDMRWIRLFRKTGRKTYVEPTVETVEESDG